MAKLAAPFAGHPLVTDVRQAGMILAIELRPEPGGTEDGNAVEIANRRGPAMSRTAPQRGVLPRPLGALLNWMLQSCIVHPHTPDRQRPAAGARVSARVH